MVIWMLILLLLISVMVTFSLVVWRFASRRWSLPCPSWLGWMVEVDNPLAKEHKARNIVKHLNISEGMVVADVGCGPGRVTIPLAHAVGKAGTVTAVDLQHGMLDKVRQKAKQEHLKNIQFLQASIGSGVLEKNRYDRIVLVCVLGEIPNQVEALQELYDALKPGGILSITESMFDPHYQKIPFVHKLVDYFGFKNKQVFGSLFCYTMHLEK